MAKRVNVTFGRDGIQIWVDDLDGRLRKRPPWYGWLIERLGWFVTGLAVWQALSVHGYI